MSNTDLINFDNTRGANYGPPTNVVFSNGLYRIPSGHVLDARPGTILFNGSLLDNVPNNNIVQGTAWTAFTVNTVTDSTPVTVLASYGNTVSGMNDGIILASRGCDASGPAAPSSALDWYVIGSGACDHNIAGTGIQMGFLGAANSSFITVTPTTPATTNRVGNVGIEHSNLCTIDTSGSNPFGFNGHIRRSFIKGCDTCNIRSFTGTICTRNSIQSSAGCNIDSSFTTNIIGSNSSTATGCTTASMLVSNSGSATNCSICLLGGSTPSASGVTNCFVWGNTSPTASNQAAFGTDIVVRNNRDLTVEAGFSSAAQGHIGNYRTVTTGTSTLLVTDGTIKLSPGTTLTLPLSSTMAANYPLDKDRSWTIIADPIEPGNLVPPVMNVTAPNLINGKTNWTSHIFKAPGQRIRLSLVNTALTTGWYIADDVEYNSYVFTAVDNNFGLVPPQSDANQLPLTANKAAHDVIGAASYVRFEGLIQNSSNLISIASPPGFAVNIRSGLDISYSFEIFFSGNAAAGYIVRADLFNVTTNTIVAGSYIEVGGNNGREGTQIVSKTCRGTVVLNTSTFQLRISQDTTNPISAAASIRNVQININASL